MKAIIIAKLQGRKARAPKHANAAPFINRDNEKFVIKDTTHSLLQHFVNSNTAAVPITCYKNPRPKKKHLGRNKRRDNK